MKKLLLFLVILAFTDIFAQTGTTCLDARNFTPSNNCFNITQNSEYLWFRFTADSQSKIIELRNEQYSTGHIHSIGILSGNCSSFSVLDSISITNGNDSLLTITTNSLIIGNDYYIITKKDNSNCLKCTTGDAEFSICLKEQQAAMDACITNTNTNTTVCCYHLEPVTSCVINACVGDILQLYLNPNTIDIIDNTGVYPNSCVNWVGTSTTGVPMSCLPSGCFPYNSTINCSNLLPGTYNVAATLQNTGVYTGQTVHFIINVYPLPSAQINAINTSPACVEEIVCINTSAIGTTITIDFGDGYNMVYSGPNLGAYTGTDCHAYIFPGTYTVTISSETGCGVTTQSQIIKINDLEPEFSAAKKCEDVGTVFTDLTTCTDPSTTWFWDFGDGNTSNQQNPVHIYNNPGTYTVTLTVSNTNISNTISHTITIQPSPATPTLNNLADFSTCKLGIPILYNISNYNSNNNYSVSVFPFSVPPNLQIGSVSSVDASGNFNVIWNVNTTCQLVITTTTSEGCEASAIVDILPCCSWNDPSKPSFINGDNTTTMQNIPGFATITGNNTIVTNKDFSINGTFTVNKDLIIRGCNVMFGNDAKIIITPGAKLSIQNIGNDVSHLFACDKMWDGIYVDGFLSSSLLTIINGTTVEDAKNAVVSNNGGEFVIQGNTGQGNVIFNKNYKGVVVNTYSGTLHPGTIRATTFECYDAVTQFTYSNSNRLRVPYSTVRSSLGIQVNNVKNINIGANILPSKNTFDNMDYGIITDNSSATIYNNFFVNITQIGLINPKEFCPKGTAVCSRGNSNIFINSKVVVGNDAVNSITFKPNTFTNCYNGIVAYRNVSLDASKNVFTNVNQGIGLFQNYLKTERIYYNTMNSVRTGVNVYDNNTSGISIWQNTINTNNQGNGVTVNEIIGNSNASYRISRNTISNVRHGIYVIGVKNASVDSNVVNLDHSAISTQACNGIYMANSSFSKIRRNSIYGENRQDWWVNGIRVFYSVTDTVTCNLTSNLGSGLVFDGTQTPGTLVARNRMSDNFRGLTLAYSIIGPQYIQNGANQDASDNVWYGNFTNSYTESYFSAGNLSPLFVRSNPGVLPFNPPIAGNYVTGGATFSSVNFFTTTNYTNTLLDCGFVQSITNGGSLKRIALQIIGDSLTSPMYDNEAKWILKQSLFKHLKEDTTLLQESLISQFNSDIDLTNTGKLDFVDEQLLPINKTLNNIINSFSINNSLNPQNIIESNSKSINGILLDQFLNGDSLLNTNQLTTLQAIAEKCPYNEGPSVLQARAILSLYTQIEYYNECENITPENNRQMENITTIAEEPNLDYILYPNPNNGMGKILINSESNINVKIHFYDLSGKKLKSIPLSKNENEINLLDFDAGVYIYSIESKNTEVYYNKFVIIK